MTIDIYLSSLSEYINGNENGEWLTLPMSNEELTNKFSEIVGKGKEWIILENTAPFVIGEYENVFKLNEFMQNISSYGLDEEEIQILAKVSDTQEDLRNTIDNGNYTIINADEVSEGWAITYGEECFGMVLHECGYNNLFSHPIPEEMIDYINFEQVWIALSINDGWEAVTVDNVTYLVTTKF